MPRSPAWRAAAPAACQAYSGPRSRFDPLGAQQQLHATRRRLFKARHDSLVSPLLLKAADGSPGEDDVRQINAQLAP